MYREGPAYALWCLFFVGLAGLHRIYMGKYGTGILWLLTFGLFGIGQFIDLFRMKGLVMDSNVREGYLPHPRWAHLVPPPTAPISMAAPAPAAAPADPPESETSRRMRRLLSAARTHGGCLTVTEGVEATGLPFPEIEGILRDMVASGYVDVDNAPDTGVVVYRFLEI
ncbi:MAG: NINE protein [Candidatus Palauibacterales bacterium]|nr:NINE protein [Candidatus Palauibacterales bacterium]MDP2528747.1 NINE protein [Candidatus Palauibacterales bacterium]MDP2585207.1 NINE protein [Candidatus Palauibacterales bacterium]